MSAGHSTTREDFVYFIAALEVGRVKIGRSVDPTGRCQGIAGMSPVDVTLLGVVRGGNRESELHAMFASDRLHGEWFSLTSRIYTWIEEHASPRPVYQFVNDDSDDWDDEHWESESKDMLCLDRIGPVDPVNLDALIEHVLSNPNPELTPILAPPWAD